MTDGVTCKAITDYPDGTIVGFGMSELWGSSMFLGNPAWARHITADREYTVTLAYGFGDGKKARLMEPRDLTATGMDNGALYIGGITADGTRAFADHRFVVIAIDGHVIDRYDLPGSKLATYNLIACMAKYVLPNSGKYGQADTSEQGDW